jgi:hypothetical protein
MNAYTTTPNWVYEGLLRGDLTPDQFTILILLYYWANRSAGYRVDSYRAERICLAMGLDAKESNLLRFRRALNDLVKRSVVRSDYQAGSKRPYHVWLTSPEVPVSLCKACDCDTDCDTDCDEHQVTHEDTASCDNTSGGADCDADCDNSLILIANNQCLPNHLQKERETLNPPAGDLTTPRPPVGGCAPEPRGSLKAAQERLSAKQYADLETLAKSFCASWTKFHPKGFVPNHEDVRRLLRKYSPLEIVFAYHTHASQTTNASLAAWFHRGAAGAIDSKRQNREQFTVPNEVEKETLDEVSALEGRWCELFHQSASTLKHLDCREDSDSETAKSVAQAIYEEYGLSFAEKHILPAVQLYGDDAAQFYSDGNTRPWGVFCIFKDYYTEKVKDAVRTARAKDEKTKEVKASTALKQFFTEGAYRYEIPTWKDSKWRSEFAAQCAALRVADKVREWVLRNPAPWWSSDQVSDDGLVQRMVAMGMKEVQSDSSATWEAR